MDLGSAGCDDGGGEGSGLRSGLRCDGGSLRFRLARKVAVGSGGGRRRRPAAQRAGGGADETKEQMRNGCRFYLW